MSKAKTAVKERVRRPQGGGRMARPEVLRACETLIAAQRRPGEIADSLAVEFKLSRRQCFRYIAAVNVRLVAESEETRPLRKHTLRVSLQAVFRRAMSKDQLGPAVQALDRLARLDGLYEEIKLGHTHSSGSGVLVVSGATTSAEVWVEEQRKTVGGG